MNITSTSTSLDYLNFVWQKIKRLNIKVRRLCLSNLLREKCIPTLEINIRYPRFNGDHPPTFNQLRTLISRLKISEALIRMLEYGLNCIFPKEK